MKRLLVTLSAVVILITLSLSVILLQGVSSGAQDADSYTSPPASLAVNARSNGTSEGIAKRTGVQYSWRDSVDTGKHMLQLCLSKALPERLQTQFTNVKQLEQYGWKSDSEAHIEECLWNPITEALTAKGLPTLMVDDWVQWRWDHEKAKEVDGQLYPATKGRNFNAYHAEKGAIVAVDNMSPGKNPELELQPSHDELVPLRHWSDITFLSWQRVCGASHDPSKLHFIFQANVANVETKHIIFEASELVAPKHILPDWPGKTFSTSSEEGQALMGTPHGKGVAYLLFQHKQIFSAQSYVDKITVWDSRVDTDEEELNPHMLFEIKHAGEKKPWNPAEAA